MEWARSGEAALTRGLRMVRAAMSAAVGVLVATGPVTDTATLSQGAVRILAAVALLNGAWNLAVAIRPRTHADHAALAFLQVLVDAVLALVGVMILDPSATPLAWVGLLVPVMDAAVAFGPSMAGAVWLTLGLAFVSLQLRVLPQGAHGAEIVRLGVLQLAAVAVIAIPAGYMAARLRDDIDDAQRTLSNAHRSVGELQLVAGHSTRLTSATNPDAVLRGTLVTGIDLGFMRVDLCRRDPRGAWRVTHTVGQGESPAANPLMGLERARMSHAPVVVGAEGTTAEKQWIHLTGFGGVGVLPLWPIDNEAAALRVFSRGPLHPDDTRLQALTIFTAQARAAWVTAGRFTALAGWSRRVQYDATHDSLTGLANRAQFMSRLTQATAGAAAGGAHFALLYLDLNAFKRINDTLGHASGDAVLKVVGQRLSAIVRADDLVARLGGDEFVVMLTSPADMDEASVIARRVCDALATPIGIGGHTVRTGTSVGVAWGDGVDTPDVLVRKADTAMYRAKREGVGGFVIAGHGPPGDHRAGTSA